MECQMMQYEGKKRILSPLRFKWTFTGILLVVVTLSSCLSNEEYSQADIQALMDEAVAEKIKSYTNIKTTRCEEDLLKEANRLADSVMIAEAFFDRDTALRPPKPEKPEKPTLQVLKDAPPVKPLFDRKKLLNPEQDSIQE